MITMMMNDKKIEITSYFLILIAFCLIIYFGLSNIIKSKPEKVKIYYLYHIKQSDYIFRDGINTEHVRFIDTIAIDTIYEKQR